MDILIPILLFVFLGMCLGISISSFYHQHIMAQILARLKIRPDDLRRVMQQMNDEVEEEEPKLSSEGLPIFEVTVESHSGQLFAYSAKDNRFMGQGKDAMELIKAVADRIQGVTIHVKAGKGAELLKESLKD